jgi:hypothetical protein
MKLSFLIQMMLLLLLVVGVYLLFTNSIEGRMKLIMIVFCLVVGIYLFMKLPMFKDNNEVLSSPQSAKNEYTIQGEELKKSDGPMGLSCWIYIDNWNYKYGDKKTIIESSNIYFPTITLDGYKNNLDISVNVYETTDDDSVNYSPEQLEFELDNNGYSFNTYNSIECSEQTDTIVLDDSIDTEVACPSKGSPENVTIENINIQKWVNVLVTFNNRTLDVYINGKLVKSKPFNNIIINGNGYDKTIYITPDGGFGGFVSKVQYFPYFITPAKAWSIYRGGFGDAFESALNKYNLSVSFYEDQVEKKKFYVF